MAMSMGASTTNRNPPNNSSSSNNNINNEVGRRTGVTFPPRGTIPLNDDGLENVDAFFAAAQSPSDGTNYYGASSAYGKRAEKLRQQQRKQEEERQRRQQQLDELEEEAAKNAFRRPDVLDNNLNTTPKQPPSWSSRMLHAAMGIRTTTANASSVEGEGGEGEEYSPSYSVLSKVSTAAPSTSHRSIMHSNNDDDDDDDDVEVRHALRGKQNQDQLDKVVTRMQQYSPVNDDRKNDYEEEEEEYEQHGAVVGGENEDDDDDDFQYDGPVDPPEEISKMSGSQGSNSRGMDPEEEQQVEVDDDDDGGMDPYFDGSGGGGGYDDEEEEGVVANSRSKAATSGSAASAASSKSNALENSLEEVVDYHDRYDDDDDDNVGGGEGGMRLATQPMDDDEHSYGGGGGNNDYFGDGDDVDDDNNNIMTASQRSRGSSSRDDEDDDEEEEPRKNKKSKKEFVDKKQKKKKQPPPTTPVTPTSVLRTSKASKKNKKKQTTNRVNWSTPNGTSKGIPAGPREYEAIPVTDYKAHYAPGEEPQTPGGSALRRSRRAKFKPLQFWKNEKLIYEAQNEEGLLGEAMGDMPVVAGVMHALPTPYKEPKRREPTKQSSSSSNKDGKKKNKDKRKRGDDDDSDEEDASRAASMEPFDDKSLRKKYRIRNGESGTVWSETLESATDTKIVSRLDNRTFSKLPLSSTRSKRESKVVGFASQAFHIPTDPEDLFPGYIAGNVVIPPRGIKDSEGVGLCSQIFTVGDCQPNSLELAVADPTGQDGEFDPDTAQRYLLSKGDMFQIPPGNVYRIENHSKKVKAALFWVIIKCMSKAEQEDDDEEEDEE